MRLLFKRIRLSMATRGVFRKERVLGITIGLIAAFYIGTGWFPALGAPPKPDSPNSGVFKRIATFPVFFNTCAGQPDDCIDESTVAEIVAASEDGNLLIYTDSETGNIGFIDITDPLNPQPAGLLAMGGSPTSVAVAGEYALVAVSTTDSDFDNPSGFLRVVHIPTKGVITTIDLGGQPDAVAVSPEGKYAAIAVENERDEDEDWPSQAPGGWLAILHLVGPPTHWELSTVNLDGLADIGPDDPEVEYVDINEKNIAVVTLQENNHIVLVHLPSGKVLNHFSAGEVDLDQIDTEDNSLIELDSELENVRREPDAVAWISDSEFATADEGDFEGGSRGFTIFADDGSVKFTAGNALEHLAARIGHYPDSRSEDQGTEPEAVKYGKFGPQRILFVATERAGIIAVYRVKPNQDPEFLQVLTSTHRPEGLAIISHRGLLIASSEEDDRGDHVRAAINIYHLTEGQPTYPTIQSIERNDGTPIPWGALSALAADPNDSDKAYTVYDSFYQESRIFEMNVGEMPALISDEIVLHDGEGGTFNFDLEGLAVRPLGAGFWAASEGAGNCDPVGVCAANRTFNLLREIAEDGEVLQQIMLPAAVNDLQRSNGFEGVASVGTPGEDEFVYLAFQAPWLGDPVRTVRIGRYEVATGEWTFFYYVLEAPISPNRGTVGLSELVAIDDETFAVIERDNQAGPDARIKTIRRFSISGLTPLPQGMVFPFVDQNFATRDLVPDLLSDNGLIIEKVEGLAELPNGEWIMVTDNDGVDGTSGETQFQHLGNIF